MKYIYTALPAVFFSLLVNRYYDKDHEYQTNQDQFYKDIDWCWARVPNPYELFVGSLPLAALYNFCRILFSEVRQRQPNHKIRGEGWD